MAKQITDDNILVLVVDRDNDLLEKAGIDGPIIGRKALIDAASKLAIKDPTDSDVNAMFAAVKKYDDIKYRVGKAEVALLTGDKNVGFISDQKINKQLDQVLDEFDADGCVFISDGAEDEHLLPLVRSKVPVISTELVIVKQSKELEKTYYVIKEAIKDPTIGRLVLGLPGIILLLYFTIGFESIRATLVILGAYLILKGFGIEDWAINSTKNFISTVSLQRLSFPFYLGTVIFLTFMSISAFGTFINEQGTDIVLQLAKTIQGSIGFLALTGASFVIGKIVDAHYLHKAYKLHTYTLILASTFIMWYILDSGLNLLLGLQNLGDFIVAIILSVIAFVTTTKSTTILEIDVKLDKKLIGKELYSKKGQLLGEISKIETKRKSVYIKPRKGRGYYINIKNLSPRADGLVKLS